MEKVRPWCDGQPSNRKRLENRTEQRSPAKHTGIVYDVPYVQRRHYNIISIVSSECTEVLMLLAGC